MSELKIKTVKKREICFSFRRKFTLCNCMFTFFDRGVETATKFHETQHIIQLYIHSLTPHSPPSILEKR